MDTFCTIITKSYLPYARVLADSLSGINNQLKLQVLIIDVPTCDELEQVDNITLYGLSEMATSEVGKKLIEKYGHKDDLIRWTLKPVFTLFLLSNGFNKVIFTDPDTFYFSDFTFLFDTLNNKRFLLTPHWRGRNPEIRTYDFTMQFTQGIYNGGFFGANNKSSDILEWWANVCLFACEKNRYYGLFDDQAYLNLIPVYFEGVEVLRHKGCNLASWNQIECERGMNNGELRISGEFPVVFIHFTNGTILDILKGRDQLLVAHLDQYFADLSKYGVDIEGIKVELLKKPNWVSWKLKAIKVRLSKYLNSWLD